MVKNAGRIVSNEILLSRIWGRDTVDEVDYLKVFIYRLRHKIEPDPAHPRFLLTERSTGYWLAVEL